MSAGAALAGGSRGPDPPAVVQTIIPIRVNPNRFFIWGGGSGFADSLATNVMTL